MLKHVLKVNVKCLIKCKASHPISKTSDSVHSKQHHRIRLDIAFYFFLKKIG